MTDPLQTRKRNPRIGSSLDEFLAEKGLLDETRDVASAEVDEWLRDKADDGATEGKDRSEPTRKHRKAPAQS